MEMTSGLIDDARHAFKTADYKQASALYTEILSKDPNSVIALLGLGYTMHCMGQTDQAFQIL
ncbi:MAG: tetratricopeptide repeat protein, partial [Anaerolineae bacterium]